MRKILRAIPFLLVGLLLAGSASAGPYNSGLGASLDSYLSGLSSPLYGLGTQLFNDGVFYNVDPRLVVAIAGAESNYGLSPTTCANDAWVWLPPASCGAGFASYSAGVDSVSLGLRQNYLDFGYTTIPLIGASYCSGPCSASWITSVTNTYTALGGDPTDLTFTASGSLITFEDYSSSPSYFGAYTSPQSVSYVIDPATTVSLSGGVTLSSATNLPGDQSTVYGSGYSPNGGYCQTTVICSSTITINFTAPVINFSTYIVNGNTVTVTYVVDDGSGNTNEVTLVPNFSSGLATVALPPTDAVTQVTIYDTNGGMAPRGACCSWDFFIDNIAFAPLN